MSRRQRVSHTPDVHPTRAKILERAVAALDEDGYDRFSVQRVLDEAEVSRPTLYRHFNDVDGLIEAALIETFRREVDRTLNIATQIVEQSTDVATFRKALRGLLRNFSTVPAAVRIQRSHTIVLTATRPQLAAAIAPVQQTLTDGWQATLEEAQRRGFVRADLNTHSAAVLIQAIALGRIVDDATTHPLTNEQWAQAHFDFIDRTFLNP